MGTFCRNNLYYKGHQHRASKHNLLFYSSVVPSIKLSVLIIRLHKHNTMALRSFSHRAVCKTCLSSVFVSLLRSHLSWIYSRAEARQRSQVSASSRVWELSARLVSVVSFVDPIGWIVVVEPMVESRW